MTTTTLITFLGRVPKSEQGTYRKTRYDFGDGKPQDEVAFFGWALAKRLRPERLVVLGTNGSMWDHLFEGDLALGNAQEAERLALINDVEKKTVTQAQLDALGPLLAERLGMNVTLRIIPYCRNDAEQMQLLTQMAEAVQPRDTVQQPRDTIQQPRDTVQQPRDTVHLDVTHGFRHLPMLALLAALYLQQACAVDVAGIWYGAFDPDTGHAPVHDLQGLLKLGQGLQALAAFDFSGDYRAFVPVLKDAGYSELADKLSDAGYYENILNVSAATGKLRALMPHLDALTARNDAAALLAPLITERIDWLQEDRQYEKQLALARHAFKRSDYLRTVLYAYEAVITRLCQQARIDITDFEGREKIRKAYEEKISHTPEEERYRLLKGLRNQVAHGTRGSRGEVQQALLNESRMRETITGLLDDIEHGRLPGPDHAH
jgi:CRISPR-associated DxTHG motif protein